MKLLLDTHVLIWWASDADKLSPRVYELLMDYDNLLLFSFASLWEIQTKLQMEKLKLDLSLPDLITKQQQVNKLEILPIELPHLYSLNDLPNHHSDPFDRLLISQSLVEKIPIITMNKLFEQYAVKRIW